MAMFAKLRSLLLGKPKTAEYRPFPVHHFTQIRDLPPFTFHTIRHMLIDPTIRLGLAMRMAPLCQAEFAFQQGDKWIPGVRADREAQQEQHRPQETRAQRACGRGFRRSED